MRPQVLALCLLSFLPFSGAEAAPGTISWVDERGMVRYFSGPQEELWLITSAR